MMRTKHLTKIINVQVRAYLIVFVLVFHSTTGKCQKNTNSIDKNEFNVELLGSNIQYSFHYERLLHKKKEIEYKMSVGLHFNPFIVESLLIDYRSIGMNFEPKLIYNIKRNSIVFGIGYTYVYLFDDFQKKTDACCADLSLLIPRLGYRIYTRSNSKYWGISFNPIFVLDLNEEGDEWSNNFIIPYGGIQYGWKF